MQMFVKTLRGAAWRAILAPSLVMLALPAMGDWAEPDQVEAVLAGEKDEANAAWWGFDPSDSTEYLQAAIDSGAARVVVPYTGEPWVVEPITIERDGLELVFEPGVVVSAKRGSFLGRGDCLLLVRDSEDIVLTGYGATLRMWKGDYTDPPYEPAEWRHALSIRGSQNVKVLGLTLAESGGDGIYIGSGRDNAPCRDITVRHVVCDANHRQGMSVITVDNLLVEHSIFSNTQGTAPQAGICLEPNNADQLMRDVVIRHNLFIDNARFGAHVWLANLSAESEPVSMLWENNYVSGGRIGLHAAQISEDSPEGTLVFRNNVVENTEIAGIKVRRWYAEGAVTAEFSGNLLRNAADRGELGQDAYRQAHPFYPRAPILLTANRAEPKRQGNVSFDNDVVVDDRPGPAVVVDGARDGDERDESFEGWFNVSGTIRVLTPHNRAIDKRVHTENFTLAIAGAE